MIPNGPWCYGLGLLACLTWRVKDCQVAAGITLRRTPELRGAVAGRVTVGLRTAVQAVVQDVVPPGEADIDRGEPVHALDGEIGRVEGFRVDPGDHRVTHVLLQEGHLWGRKEVAIPVGAVTKVENGIWLNLTKKQVEDLPPVG
jgi:hypothetical protein